MSSVFIATAKGGKLSWGSLSNEARLSQELKDNEGKSYRLTQIKPMRSINQNRLYWKYLEIIERETGNASEDLHQYFRRVILPPEFKTVLGQEVKLPRSTTELTKDEFSDYLDKISAMVEIPIPSWDELVAQGYIKN